MIIYEIKNFGRVPAGKCNVFAPLDTSEILTDKSKKSYFAYLSLEEIQEEKKDREGTLPGSGKLAEAAGGAKTCIRNCQRKCLIRR